MAAKRPKKLTHLLGGFSLGAFERLDIGGKNSTKGKELARALEHEIATRVSAAPDSATIAGLIGELNAVGHHFELKPSRSGWISYYESTNNGARSFYIHVELGDITTVMVLYHETIETTVAKRRAAVSPRERARADKEDEFANRGLALNTGEVAYRDLKSDDKLIACLHELEGGVNNGGFSTYLENTDGARITDAARFLDAIGAERFAAIVRDVIELFPGGFGPAFRKSANVLVDSKRDALDLLTERFYKCRENIALLALRHVKARSRRTR